MRHQVFPCIGRDLRVRVKISVGEHIFIAEVKGPTGPPASLVRNDTVSVCAAALVVECGIHPYPINFAGIEAGGNFMVTGHDEGGKIFLCDISSPSRVFGQQQQQTTFNRHCHLCTVFLNATGKNYDISLLMSIFYKTDSHTLIFYKNHSELAEVG